ncbi:MAG: PilN domain-containing protein [Phycisphaerae bacterium]|jgi:Tfp pilus assembly protein PilN
MGIINLLPDDYLKRRSQQRANIMCLVLFGIVMAGVGGAALVSERSTRYTREVADRVNASYVDATRMIEELRQLEAKKAQMLRKAEMTARLLERVPRSTLLAVVTNALPRQASLTQFQLIPKLVVRAEPVRPAGETTDKFNRIQDQRSNPPQSTYTYSIEVTGMAGTDVEVAKFITNLVRNPLLTSVDLAYSQEKLVNERPVREFQVKMEVRSDIDVMDVLQNTERPAPPAPKVSSGSKAAADDPVKGVHS